MADPIDTRALSPTPFKMLLASSLFALMAPTLANASGKPCPPTACANLVGEATCTPAQPQSCQTSEPTIEGFGASSTFGGGSNSEACIVSNLNNDGAGSLRACIENRNGSTTSPTPRTITFSVAGEIVLTEDLPIRQPYLTIDGLSAPSPGITIAKTGSGENGETAITTWPRERTCGHDVLVQGLRFKGVWSRTSTAHSQNADNLGMDGEDFTNCLRNVVVWRNTFINGQDTVAGFWGSVTDATFAYNFLLYNYHPQQISHWPGNETNQQRERLSIHHNIYAYAHERLPNIRGNTWQLNITQNVFHRWNAFGFGWGYATKFRCRNGGCPQQVNLVQNHWTSAGSALNAAIEFQDGASTSQVYMRDNTIPSQETDRGTAATAFNNPDGVTTYSNEEFVSEMFQYIGHQYPSAEETSVKQEVRSTVESEMR